MAKKKRLVTQPGYVEYLRTSDEEAQAPQRSQGAQRREIAARLVSFYQLPRLREYVDNYTGTSSDRRFYQMMLTDARMGSFSHVFSSTPDRFGRDDVEALRAIDELTAMGIVVRFASHPDLDPADPDDRLYLNILFGMAKRESAVTGKRVRDGMTSKLLNGEWPWRAPDGYFNKEQRLTELGLSKDEQHKYARYKRWIELDPDRGEIWRTAWDLLLQDRPTLEDICQALHLRGYRLRNGTPFIRVTKTGRISPNRQALSRVFHNWFYAGWIVVDNDWVSIAPKTVAGQWTPIVSVEEFELGVAILERRNQKPTPERKNFYLT